MPELPDVEGFRRVLTSCGRRIVTDIEVRDAGVLRGVTGKGTWGRPSRALRDRRAPNLSRC